MKDAVFVKYPTLSMHNYKVGENVFKSNHMDIIKITVSELQA